jgi:hypothetical protein
MLEEKASRPTVDLDVWLALRQLEEVFERLLARGKAVSERREASVDYASVRGELEEPVARLRERLDLALPEPRALPGESWAEQIFSAVLIRFDECELESNHGASRVAAPLLQTEYANTRDGGERFYVFLERALRSRATPALVLQLFLYCMKGGFCGRYPTPEDPERLAYLRELSFRVSPPPSVPADAQAVVAPPPPIVGRRFPYWNYAIAALALFVLWSSLQVAASVHEIHLVGMTTCEDP